MENFFKKIGLFFRSLFNSAERTWKKVSPEVRDALTQGSSIVDIINRNMQTAPEFVIELIQKAHPSLDRLSILAALRAVADALNIAEDIVEKDELPEVLQAIQKHLEKVKSDRSALWAGLSSLAAQVIALAFAPKGTKWATFVTLIEFVYQRFIKKD